MKKYLTLLLFFLLLIFLSGCPGAIDSITFKELGHGYIYHEIVGLPTISKDNSNKNIPCIVVSYNYNNNFIIALQKDYKLSEKEKDLITEDEYYDLAMEKGISKFWIISHSLDSIFGPMNKEDFNKKRKELGVPDNLKLKIE